MIERQIKIENLVEKNKVLIIYGPRQVGKTTLLKKYLSSLKDNYILKTGDDIPFSEELSRCDLHLLRSTIPKKSLFVIDEAQKIPNIGRALKLIVDNIDGVTIIATGSSSFDLLQATGETLTGRKKVVTLYPVSMEEFSTLIDPFDLHRSLPNLLVFGMYPAVLTADTNNKKIQILQKLANSYLLKDILEFDKIKHSKKIFDLLKLLAFQVGSEVSTNELGSSINADKNTVAHYLDLLEKSFVLFRLNGFSRNLRKEVSKMSKYYFYDNGIRNALISSFNPLETRNDIGQLWENFIIMERVKRNSYYSNYCNYYFWRTYDKKEIDLIEEKDGKLFGYEFKWKKEKIIAPKDWINTYENSGFEVITSNNYLDFLNLQSK